MRGKAGGGDCSHSVGGVVVAMTEAQGDGSVHSGWKVTQAVTIEGGDVAEVAAGGLVTESVPEAAKAALLWWAVAVVAQC